MEFNKRISNLPPQFKEELWEFINKCITLNLDGELLNTTVLQRIEFLENSIDSKHKIEAPESTLQTHTPQETQKSLNQKPGPSNSDLIDVQAKSDLRYNYTPFIQLTLPHSDDAKSVENNIHSSPHQRFQRQNNLQTVTWASTMPDWNEENCRVLSNGKNNLHKFILEQPVGLPSGIASRFLLSYIFTKYKNNRNISC